MAARHNGHRAAGPLADLAGERLLTGREVDRLLRISRSTRERLLAAGKLPRPIALSRTLHRWKAKDVIAWLDGLKR